MYKHSIAKKTITCEVCGTIINTEKKGMVICDCGKYTYIHATRPHKCGCRGKMEIIKLISYGENKDYIT